MNKNERFLITGAAGFVGACLVHRLIQGNRNVSIIVKPGSNLWRLKSIYKKINIYKANLCKFKEVQSAVGGIKPTVIYHLAAHGAYSSQNNAEEILKTNIFGTWNLLKACSDFDYKTFINVGTSSEYGFKSKAFKETDYLEPNSYYAVAKASQTLLCQYVAKSQNRSINTLRLLSAYGYFEEPTRLIPTLITSCLEGKDLRMVSPDTARDFVFIDDVLDAFLKIDQLGKLRGEIFNVGTGRQSTLKEVVEIILKLTHASVKVQWGKMPAKIWDTNMWVCDPQKSRKLLGWKAKNSLYNGLEKTVEWFRKNKKLYVT